MSDIVERKLGELIVQIDRETCIATENCIAVAPDVFELDGENICSFKGEPGAIARERLIEACQVCPVDALIVIDASSGKQIVP